MGSTLIAAILTVHNRKEKTLECLKHLFAAAEGYNRQHEDGIVLTVFLTDDGCTDGTAQAVNASFPRHDIHILQGSGSLFWAGGMRLAWQEAIDTNTPWEYYLLLNDDTYVWNNVFEQLFDADRQGFRQVGIHGLSSGITCQPGNPDEITYGGFLFEGRSKGCHRLALPTGEAQQVDMTHCNILLVHRDMVERCGIFHKGYIHSCADEDYSLMAQRRHLPTLVTAQVCGECECDHDTNKEQIERLIGMTLAERKQYFSSVTHSDHDYLLFIRRNFPLRYPASKLLHAIRLYHPKMYYRITNFRGVYQQS